MIEPLASDSQSRMWRARWWLCLRAEAATKRSTQLAAPPPVQYRARASDRSTVYHVQRQASSSFKPHQLRCQVSDGPQTDGIDTFVRRCTMRKERKKQKSRQVGQHVRAACFPAFASHSPTWQDWTTKWHEQGTSCHGMNDPQYQIKSLQSA